MAWFDGRVMVRELPDEAIRECSSQGDVSSAVEYWAKRLSFDPPGGYTREYLKGYGAWEESELNDEGANVQRALWIICCNLRDYPDMPVYLGD